MPKGRRGIRGKSDPLRWKPGIRINRSVFGRLGETEKSALLRAAAYIQNGKEMEGTHLVGSWRNPENRNPLHANWKTDGVGQSLSEFFITIHGARNRCKDGNAVVRPTLGGVPGRDEPLPCGCLGCDSNRCGKTDEKSANL